MQTVLDGVETIGRALEAIHDVAPEETNRPHYVDLATAAAVVLAGTAESRENPEWAVTQADKTLAALVNPAWPPEPPTPKD